MNGKYMGWREQRWVERDAERLQRMEEKRLKREKQAAMAAADKGEMYRERPN